MLQTNEPLLSVIVTVYNTEKYLVKCIESVLNSTYKNIQLVVVDDASPGNIDEIMGFYVNHDKRVKYVKHEVNKGLFHARITGVENSDGEFIAFLDSDDHVSCDFYRKLVLKAVETDSDMVIGEYLLEYEDGSLKYQNLAHTRILNIDVSGDDATKLLFDQCGRDFSLHVVWNKVYSRKLWDRCYPYFLIQKQHLIMCEDVLYSCLFYYCANHVTNIHHDYYYYVQNSQSLTGNLADFNKFRKNILDVKLVFDFLKELFGNKLNELKLLNCINSWEKLIIGIWRNNIESSNLNYIEKRKLYKFIETKERYKLEDKDNAFYNLHTDVPKLLSEELKKKILNSKVKVVSFDIFDTLILRPFFQPTDLFYILDVKVNKLLNISDKINIKDIRVESEILARKKKHLIFPMQEEISLDEIYESFKEITGFDSERINSIKLLEIDLEKKYCVARCYAKEIFDLALYLNKRVIITSDMYLPEAVIKDILSKNGYLGFEKLYLSGSVNLTKATGNLYTYILKDLSIEPSEMLHIGDNLNSDVRMAESKGVSAFLLPKTVELLGNQFGEVYSGESILKIFNSSINYRRKFGTYDYFGTRTLLAVVANKIFDNPYVPFNINSDFNADPRIIGYYCLGLHLYAIADWLIDNASRAKYNNINFMARDGYLPKKAFDILNKQRKLEVRTNYLPLTRQSILTLQIDKKEDLFSLPTNINIFNQSPESVIRLLSFCVDSKSVENTRSMCESKGFVFDKKFDSLTEFYKFIKFFSEKIFDISVSQRNNTQLFEYLKPFYEGNTADFDIGYSCRIESILKQKFGFNISSYFIHISNDLALYRAKKSDVRMKTFFNYSPGVTGLLRELLISELAPSCESITFENGKPVYKFKNYTEDYYRDYVLGTIQKYSLMFVEDVVKKFEDDIDFLFYQREDISLPHEYYNTTPSLFDRELFKGFDFEDDLGLGDKVNFLEVWTDQINNVVPAATYNQGETLSWMYPLWKRAICLYFLDRNLLKRKVEKRLVNKPTQLRVLKKIYSSLRYIYRKFK